MEQKYEGVFIIKNGNQETIEKIIEAIENILKNNKCEVFKREKLGIKKLAYSIGGEKQGYYYLVNFKADKNKKSANKVEEKINTIEEILRHIIVEVDE